jgi:hypothetical protein
LSGGVRGDEAARGQASMMSPTKLSLATVLAIQQTDLLPDPTFRPDPVRGFYAASALLGDDAAPAQEQHAEPSLEERIFRLEEEVARLRGPDRVADS